MSGEHLQAERTYHRHLPTLQQWVGWFALVRGDRLGGVFPNYQAAAAAWMGLYGPVPALIRRIDLTVASTAALVADPTTAAPRQWLIHGIGRPAEPSSAKRYAA